MMLSNNCLREDGALLMGQNEITLTRVLKLKDALVKCAPVEYSAQ